MFTAAEDRYGGVEITASPDATAMEFEARLRSAIDEWSANGKRGLWLKIPLACAAVAGAAAACGFEFHHAQPGYVMMTRWLPASPSPLPKYGFTQIGVGGVVLNAAGEVLMVQERVSPSAQFQGSWKLPGGLSDPGEQFADTVIREVREETAVVGTLEGVVSLRHSHGFRFGQGDIYVVVRLRADPNHESIVVDPNELLDARWMAPATIESLVERDSQKPLDGKVSENNWKMIQNALHGNMIVACSLAARGAGKPALLYTAAAKM